MSTSLVDLARAYVASETPTHRESADGRISELKEKYAPGGGWQLLQPGPLTEACEIWLQETRQFGLAVVDHVFAKAGSADHADIESLRRFMQGWATREQEEYIMPSFKAFMEERGIKVQQQVGNIREQVGYRLAQITKEILTAISDSGRTAKAAS